MLNVVTPTEDTGADELLDLLGQVSQASGVPDAEAAWTGERADPRARIVETRLVRQNPNNTRKHFNEEKLNELEEQVREHGILHPLVVREIRYQRVSEKHYEVVAGDRRLIVANRIGLQEIPIIVREADRAKAKLLNMSENLGRDDVSAAEYADGIAEMIELRQAELAEWLRAAQEARPKKGAFTQDDYRRAMQELAQTPPWIVKAVETAKQEKRAPRYTQEHAAAEIGIKERQLRNYLLVSELDAAVKKYSYEGRLGWRQTVEIARLGNAPAALTVARQVVSHGLNSERTKKLVDERLVELGKLKPRAANAERGNRNAEPNHSASGNAESRHPTPDTRHPFTLPTEPGPMVSLAVSLLANAFGKLEGVSLAPELRRELRDDSRAARRWADELEGLTQ